MIFRPSVLLLFTALAASAAERVSFNRDIRPILSDKCFACHGPDDKKRDSGLRLDLREQAVRPAESGDTAIVPGKPDASQLIARVLSKDRDEVMPPPKTHKPVGTAEVELLRRWIAEGAEYQGHWAFIKPERPAVPPGSANPIDAFILKKLGESGLKPSPEADRATLLRRVTLDLTGIPPTPAEVAAFSADAGANAYEKAVDRLLASPRYGEQMAQQWLDFARYADSHGFQTDTSRTMWPWRDWVIRAFNENKPFDRFTVEQLAGDLLPGATREQIVATGFHRNHRINGEGGIIDEEWFIENVIDRVETTGLTWMALTLNCCRCHDHKYDPIAQKEFYQLFAYFNSVDEQGTIRGASNRSGGNPDPFVSLPDAAQEVQLAKLKAAVKDAEAKADAVRKAAPQRQAAWEPKSREALKAEVRAWTPLVPAQVHSEGGATFSKQADDTWLAGGVNPAHDVYVITAPLAAGPFSGILLEAFPDASLPAQSLGRNDNGNYVLTDVDLEISAVGKTPVIAPIVSAAADYDQKGWEVKTIVADKAKRKKGDKGKVGWAVDGPTKKEPRKAMFLLAAPVTIPSAATLKVTLRHDALAKHNIGRFRLSATSLPPALVKVDGAKIPPTLRESLNVELARRTPAQKAEVEKFFSENADPEQKAADAGVAAAKKEIEALEGKFATVMVMREKPKPREAAILKRGEYDKPGDKVARALPAVFSPMPPGAPNDRLGLAQWLVSGAHPLTARVWVNRAWEKFFGTGLVKTSENLGSQSEWPSHPELLDWLAVEFVRLKWDMKAIQKEIVMSATYRQSSRVTPALLAKDPENRLLARAPRLRLPAETMRDQALAVSGLLVEKLGGPSVRPYMPAAVWDETSVYGDMRGYKADTGEGLYRRTLYTVWKRTAAPPSMLLFDSPSREICTVKRSRTNTPLQALALLNEVTYVEAARRFAERMLTEGGAAPEARIAWAFERATARKPDAFELEKLTANLRTRLTAFAQDADAAAKLGAQGASKPAANLNPAELAAYTVTANVLLNLDEVITRN